MKVWITRYALTQGIIEAEVTEEKTARSVIYVYYGKIGNAKRMKNIVLSPGEVCFDRQSAVEKAEKMRTAKIGYLEKQLEKLRKINFK